MKKTKAEIKIDNLMAIIKKNYLNKPFTFADVVSHIPNNGRDLTFYSLSLAGAIQKIKRGVFVFKKDMGSKKIYDIASGKMLEKRLSGVNSARQERQLKSTERLFTKNGIQLDINDTFTMTEEKAITFLKDLGYKILKPVKEFQEV